MAEIRPLGGFAVLVVEDDPDTLESATSLIRDFLGCEVLTASSGDDATRIIDAGFRVDLLFADIVMPKMDGLTLTRFIRQRSPNLPVVLTTGLPNAVDMALECGAFALIKPYSPARLEALFTEQLRFKTHAKSDRPSLAPIEQLLAKDQ